MRLIGYIRVSRVAGREGERFISPDVQRERIEAQATASGHAIVEWFEDLDQPGSRYERPGFQAALEMVERREADGVVVAALDRFARNVADAAMALGRLDAVGGALISVRDSLDTSTPMGRFARTMMLAIAELELERIRETWATSGRKAAERGVHVSRVPPLGYLRGDDGRLFVDEATAPAVRELFQRRAAGASWSQLCAFLDERLPRERGAWRSSSVSTLIRCRTYLGEARGGSTVNPTAHASIVTRAEWEAAQSVRSLAPGRGVGSLLAGIARCGTCGGAMTNISDGARGYRKYRCQGRSRHGVCTTRANISTPRLDTFVEQAFLERLAAEPVALAGAPPEGELEAAQRSLDAAEVELAAYRDAELISAIGRVAFVAGLKPRAQAVEAARSALADAQRSLERVSAHVDLAESWPTLTTAERRAILAETLEAVVVTTATVRGQGTPVADRVQIVWRGSRDARAVAA
jgi:site-specific DNA recombinase